MKRIVELSGRGQITLPAGVRKALGLRSGDALVVSVVDGRVVLEPAVVLPVELYTDERIEEFRASSEMTAEELARARRRWRA